MTKEKQPFMQKVINGIEKATRFIPGPIKMFLWLILFVMIISTIVYATGASWTNAVTGDKIVAANAFSKDFLQWLLSSLVTNFTNYMAYGPVVVMMLAVGICEETGVMAMMMKKATSRVSDRLVPLVICFIGVMSNIADNTSIFVITPLAGFAYLAVGKNPILGMITAYLTNTSGMAANLLLANADVLSTGITNSILLQIGSEELSITCNWYFMATSCLVLTFTCYFVSEKILAKSLPPLTQEHMDSINGENANIGFTEVESKALNKALIALAAFVGIIVVGVYTGVLQDETGVNFVWNNLVAICFFGFLVFGVTYGMCAKTVHSINDIHKMAIKATSRMAGYTVLVFIMAQFTSILAYTNLTRILAIAGSEFLQKINFTGIGMIVVFILVVGFINMFMTSQTAKWSIFAPIIVPIFQNLGWSPALAQAAFRVADSSTNCMSPISPFLFMMIDISKDTFKCKDTNTSQWLSLLIPSCLIILVVWTTLLVIWILLDLPLGPGAYIRM